ncbi:ferritin-like domain-containing protein [Thermithiobacillus plumbiphilus]|uniref:Ferritin-like domain-containing protein n=1 Tax=Thermithiobacillus plumbiphilus TaxID=1729899 RepID=A0ABU9D8Z5_9PROT
MSSENLHENTAKLKPETIDRHRAIISMMEEFEAVDWYQQRADATDDPQLRAILIHNMNEELEHACMILEWLRRRMPKLDENLREYLFTEGDITQLEHGHAPEDQPGAQPDSDSKPIPGRRQSRFTVGDLKGE